DHRGGHRGGRRGDRTRQQHHRRPPHRLGVAHRRRHPHRGRLPRTYRGRGHRRCTYRQGHRAVHRGAHQHRRVSAMSADGITGVLAEVDEWPVGTVGAAVVTTDVDGPVLHGDADRLFALASVSKLITCYSVLIAVEEGAFDLDDTVDDIAAEYG